MVIPATGTVAVDGGDVTGRGVVAPGGVGGWPVATAVSITDPAVTSPAVVVYVEVNVAVPPTPNVAVAPEHNEPVPVTELHVGAANNAPDVDAPAWSATATPESVVLPVLVVTNEYETFSPDAEYDSVDDDFTTVIPANSTVTVDGPDVSEPPGDVPVATAVSTTFLAVTSAVVVL
jgi:hypothetical protein